MKATILKNYFTVFTDCWELFKKFQDLKADDEYWNSLIRDGEALYKKHGRRGFSGKLITLVMEELEELYTRSVRR